MVPETVAIVVTRNAEKWINPLFGSLESSTMPPGKIMVLDNGSDDRTLDFVRKACPRADIIALEQNFGFSRANNIGLSKTSASRVLFINQDVVLAPDCIESMHRALDLHAMAAFSFPRLFRPDGSVDSLGLVLDRARTGFDLGSREYPQRPGTVIMGASAAVMLASRSALRDLAVNGEIFDEDFFAYREDVDLCWRAALQGYICVRASDGTAVHDRGSVNAMSDSRFKAMNFRNRYFMMIKNDRLGDLAIDILPLLIREFGNTLRLFRYPWLWLGLFSLVKGAGRMFAKRRIIQARCKLDAAGRRALFSPPQRFSERFFHWFKKHRREQSL